MLAVDGKEIDTVVAYKLHNEAAACDERFLCSKRNVLSGFYGGDERLKPHCAEEREDDHIHVCKAHDFA